MPQDDSLLRAAESWYRAHKAVLAGRGVKITLIGRAAGAANNAVIIQFESGMQVLQATVSDSGETAFLLADRRRETDPRIDSRTVADPSEVDHLLDAAVRIVSTTDTT